jgi:hypothetical protein
MIWCALCRGRARAALVKDEMSNKYNGPLDSSYTFGEPEGILRHAWETSRRAFVEFLKVPTFVIIGFLLLALVMYVLDAARIDDEGHVSRSMSGGLFSDIQATRDFLGVISGRIITVTSITLSLLLIAVQQGAASLTSLVFDQFLRRRLNQLYFGFFIGLALYSLVVLASTNSSHQPTYGVAVAGLLTVVALCMLILLIYTTIDQMRPAVIIKSIHDHTLLARRCQLELLSSTRRSPRLSGAASSCVAADRGGFLTRVDVAAIAKAAADAETEITIMAAIGDYVAFGELVAEIRTGSGHDLPSLQPVVRKAVALEEQRDLDTDPAFGVEQLATIGWTSISTAKSNPGPGVLAIWNLRDILARWLHSDHAFAAGKDGVADPSSPVIYFDNLPIQLMRAFESLAVVASESMQHQSAAEIYRTFATLYHRFPVALRRQADDLLLRSLSGLGDHILTTDLEAALSALSTALTAHGQSQCGAAVVAALDQLKQSIGHLNSRSTRTQASGERGCRATEGF